jgi:hypothetical protein
MRPRITALFMAISLLMVFAPTPAAALRYCYPGRSGGGNGDYVWKMDMTTSPRFRVMTMTIHANNQGLRQYPYVETKYSAVGMYFGNDPASNPFDMDVGMELLFQPGGLPLQYRAWVENANGGNDKFVNAVVPGDWGTDLVWTMYHDSIFGQESWHISLNNHELIFSSNSNGVDGYYATVGTYTNYRSQFWGALTNRFNIDSLFYDNDSPSTQWGYDLATDRDDLGTISQGSQPNGQFGGTESLWDAACA